MLFGQCTGIDFHDCEDPCFFCTNIFQSFWSFTWHTAFVLTRKLLFTRSLNVSCFDFFWPTVAHQIFWKFVAIRFFNDLFWKVSTLAERSSCKVPHRNSRRKNRLQFNKVHFCDCLTCPFKYQQNDMELSNIELKQLQKWILFSFARQFRTNWVFSKFWSFVR